MTTINFLTNPSYNVLNTYTLLGGGAITSIGTTTISSSSVANYGFGTVSGSITGTFSGGTALSYPNATATSAMSQMLTLANAISNALLVPGALPFPTPVSNAVTLNPGIVYYWNTTTTLLLNGVTITFNGAGQYITFIASLNGNISFTNCNFIYTGVDPSTIFWSVPNGITLNGTTGPNSTIPGIFLTYGTQSGDSPTITTTNAIINGNLYAGTYSFPGAINQGTITSTNTTLNSTVACFLKGTKILTERGYFFIEDLQIEDKVIIHGSILDNSEVVLYEKIQTSPIKWIGKFNSYRHDATDLPVCFKVGSLGEFIPENELFVSPGHRMIIDGKIVAARNLVNGETIIQEDTHETIEYYHFELDCHGIIMTEGVLSETFLELGDSKLAFQK